MVEPRLNEIFKEGLFTIQCKDSSKLDFICSQCVYDERSYNQDIEKGKYCFDSCCGCDRFDNKDVYFIAI